MRRRRAGQHAFSRESGQGLFVLLALLLFVGAGLIFSLARPAPPNIKNNEQTTAALAQAKDALIGWSVQRTSSVALPNARPGELPCPDNNNDGFEDGTCVAGALGRVPWKTLGIPEPKDGAGETLWYALAGPFRIWAVNANQIDNDTKGNITVYSGSSSTVMTLEAVAVIFAPGAVLGAQDRSCTVGVNCTATGQCTTSPASLTPKCNPTNYLDTTGGGNNATTNGPYISAQPSNTFNDRLLVITTDSLMTVVEKRVAREMLALLERYRTAPGKSCPNNCYTWADEDFTNEGDNDAFRGWLPLGEADPDDWSVPPPIPVGLNITVPAWLTNNDWWKVVYYAVAPDKTENNSGGTLTVVGDPSTYDVVLITPGPALPGVARPNPPLSPTPTPAQIAAYWAQYLNDPENSDHINNIYVRPSSSAYTRDRIYVVP